MYFSFQDALKFFPMLFAGVKVALFVTVVAMALALVQGLLLALARLSPLRILRTLSTVWVEIIRGTPCLLQIYYIYFVAPSIGIVLSPLTAGILGLSVNYGAYSSEVFRASILSIRASQWEAGQSLGMSKSLIMRRIIVPQAVRKIVPPLGNYLVLMVKDTSLLSTITIREIMMIAYEQSALTFKFFELFTYAGILYLGLSYPLSLFVDWVERKLDVDRLTEKRPWYAGAPHLLSLGTRKETQS
jgi:polar amino acid transport system permease protein